MTIEDYNILKKYELHLHSAQSDFMRGLSSKDLKELDEVYNRILPNKKSKLLGGCSRCILHSLQDIAEVYFNYKPEPEQPKINKRGRPKKEDGKEE